MTSLLERKKERKKIKKEGELSLLFFKFFHPVFFIDNGHNLFLDPVQKFRLIHLHQEGLKTLVQCLDAIY